MQTDVELYANSILLMSMVAACSLLTQIDPVLASLWVVVTFLMSWHGAT